MNGSIRLRTRLHYLIAAGTLFILAICRPLAAIAATPNPYLAAPVYGITHFDSAQTDTFPFTVPGGTRTVFPPAPLQVPQSLSGPINIMTLASTSPNYMWGVSTTAVSYLSVAGGTLAPVAVRLLPGVTQPLQTALLGLLSAPITTVQQGQSIVSQIVTSLPIAGGLSSAYSLVDLDNVLYVNYGTNVYAFALVNPSLPLLGIQILRTLDATTFLQSGESIAGLVLTYDGNLVVLGSHSATVVSRTFTGPTYTVQFGSGETISNSAAVDENNGIYIVTDKMMHKLVWTGSALSQNAADGAWTSPYSTGDTYPTLFGSGSGSTPALMGSSSDPDQLVVITDGLKRMSLVAFWRNAIPPGFTNRVAGTIQVNCGLPASYEIQSDQSVAVNGYGAFVVNNVSASDGSTGTSTALVNAFVRGPVLPSPTGVERFAWNPQSHTWSSVWARPDVSDNSMVPTVSSGSNMVFTSGYYPSVGWQVVGLDWNSGSTVHTTTFGAGEVGNGVYAIIQFLSNGDLLFNSVIGPTRVTMPAGTLAPL